MEKTKDYVQKWIDSHEPGTFRKSDIETEGYWYTSKDGVTSINLSVFFENLLEDYTDQQTESLREELEKVKKELVSVHVVNMESYIQLKQVAESMVKLLIRHRDGDFIYTESLEALTQFNNLKK